MTIHIGISGWQYPPWRGAFYPKGLVQKKELEFASRNVTAIEINGTFYSLKKPEHYLSWYDQVPEDFVFAIKGNKFITHTMRAKNADQGVANFYASGLLALGKKLGPILWQFPPNLGLKDNRFESFIKSLPKTWDDAVETAHKHNDKVKGNTYLNPDPETTFRHAFELRHPDFLNKDFLAMLREYNIAAVFGRDGDKTWPEFADITADFSYFRMHGLGTQQKEGYKENQIQALASDIRVLGSGSQIASDSVLLESPEETPRDTYVFFDNDTKAMAPKNAMELMKSLKISPHETFDDSTVRKKA